MPADIGLKSPYAWCALGVCLQVMEWMERNLGEHDPVEFIFEEGDKDQSKFLKRFKELSPGADPPIFRKKAHCIPFQIADFLAWEHRRFILDKQSRRRPTRGSYVALLEQIPHDVSWSIWHWDNLERTCKRRGYPKRNASS
jgi:hypothetical protein